MFVIPQVDQPFPDSKQFSLENRESVGVLASPTALPPQDELLSGQYEYCAPPMPAHVFMHYMKSSKSHTISIWSQHLPRKRDRSITEDARELPIGYGVHIIEGSNKRAFFWLTLVVVLMSVLISSFWACLKKDIQGAFAIGAWLVSIPTVITTACYIKWS